jgi:hypothetical protein
MDLYTCFSQVAVSKFTSQPVVRVWDWNQLHLMEHITTTPSQLNHIPILRDGKKYFCVRCWWFLLAHDLQIEDVSDTASRLKQHTSWKIKFRIPLFQLFKGESKLLLHEMELIPVSYANNRLRCEFWYRYLTKTCV